MLPQLFTSGTTKTAIASLAQQAVSEALENGNPIAAAEIIAALEAFVKAVKDTPGFKDAVRDELERSGGKIITPSGAKLEAVETGVSYDYSHDSVHRLLKGHADKAAAELKQHEEFLKRIPAGKEILDPETGEVLGVGPSKSSTSSYRLTLAK